MRVCVNAVMGISFCVNFLLLLGTSSLSGFSSEKKRLLAGAMLGAVYSGACLLPGFHFLGNLLWRIVSLGLMGSIAFGWDRYFLHQCGMFVLLSLALSGMAVRFSRWNDWQLMAAAAGLWFLCKLLSLMPEKRSCIPLKIRNGSRSVSLLALQDTGNTLRDPVTGEQVLVVERAAAAQLTGLTEEQIRHPLETMVSQPVAGLHLIPFRTIGQGRGMMLAMRFEHILLNGRKMNSLVAFAPENFGCENIYQALTGGGSSW